MKKIIESHKRKKPYNRFDYIDYELSLFDDGGHHDVCLVSLCLSPKNYHELSNEKTFQKAINDNKSRDGQRLLETEIVNEWEEYYTRRDSEEFEKEFKAGNEDAIFMFCRKRVLAFRYNWVLHQIEKWKREKSKDSLKKLNRLFKEYSKSTGKTEADELRLLIRRDKKIYSEYLKFDKTKYTYNECLELESAEFLSVARPLL